MMVRPVRSLGGTAGHHESFGLLQVCSNFIHFFLFSFGSWCSESHHFLPSWLVTAGKMRDFWGQMCFHSTIIMPLKILIALAVFLGGPWAGWEDSGSECLQQLREVRNMFPPFTQDVLLQSLGDLPAQCSELVTTVKNKDTTETRC